MGATALRTNVETDHREVENEERDVPLISASAAEKKESFIVAVSNRDLVERNITIQIDLREVPETVDGRVLFDGIDLQDYPTAESAENFGPKDIEVDIDSNGELIVHAPATSVIRLSI